MESAIKFTLLVPLRYNDGRKIPKRLFDLLFADMFKLAGGVTYAHKTKGAYRMADGTKKIDECLSVSIAVEKNDVSELKRLVGRMCATRGQESMYLEQSASEVEFITVLALP